MGMQKAQVYIDAPLTGCLRSPAGKLAVTLKAFVSQGSMGVSAPSFWRQDQPEALPPPLNLLCPPSCLSSHKRQQNHSRNLAPVASA